MEKGRAGKRLAKKLVIICISLSIASAMFTVFIQPTSSHSGDVLNSSWASVSPTIDGVFSISEWDDATVVDLGPATIPNNAFNASMFIMNNDTHLFICYDVIDDITNNMGPDMMSDDMAAVAFDCPPPHDGIPTDGEDHQFVINGSGITQHLNYSTATLSWVQHCSPFSEPGLLGEAGFGPSPNNGTNHRIYEFQILLSLIGASPGETVGFATVSDPSPGIWDASIMGYDTWPINFPGPPPLDEYGNLVFDTAPALVEVRLTPDFQSAAGVAGAIISYNITAENRGTGFPNDLFDMVNISLWPVSFWDSTGSVLLTDHNGNSIPDTDNISSGTSIDIVIKVEIPIFASPGDSDTAKIMAISDRDPLVNDTANITTIAAFGTPWIDDMELGVNGWTFDGLWHQVNSSDPSAPPWNISYSPSHSWWYGQDATGNYETGASNSGSLTSPFIDLTGLPSAELTFWYWYETEPPPTDFDQRWVQIKVGNGSWQNLGRLYSEPMQVWIQNSTNLTAYVGDVIQIRFFFDTGDEFQNAFRGWYLDDVRIGKAASLPPENLTSELNGTSFDHIKLSWDKSPDDGSGSDAVTEYIVYRSTTINGVYSPIGTPIPAGDAGPYSFVDINAGDLAPYIDYFYYVKSNNTDGSLSMPSNKAGKFVNPLDTGWNLISIPLMQENQSQTTVLQTIDPNYESVQAYKAGKATPWLHWHKNKPNPWNDNIDFNRTSGYYIHMNAPDYLISVGRVPTQTLIHLKAGWNLVGYPSFTLRHPALITFPFTMDKVEHCNFTDPDPWKEWDPGPSSPDDLTEMRPGEGYWIHTTGEAFWAVNW